MAALAHGMPIISTEAEIVNPLLQGEENMLLAPASDISALATQVRRLAEDPSLREQLGEKAKDTADAFSWPKIASKTLEFYSSVLAEE